MSYSIGFWLSSLFVAWLIYSSDPLERIGRYYASTRTIEDVWASDEIWRERESRRIGLLFKRLEEERSAQQKDGPSTIVGRRV